MLAPLVAVLLFLAVIVVVFAYLRLEEIDREQEALRHDLEYAQQQLRLRLLERQEQLMRVARELGSREMDTEEFKVRAESLVNQYPELNSMSWIDERRRIKASYSNLSASHFRLAGETLTTGETENTYNLAREVQQPVYSQRSPSPDSLSLLELHIPLAWRNKFAGVLLVEYSVDGLYRFGVPAEVTARYAFSLHDAKGELLAGTSLPKRNPATRLLPWANPANEYEVPVSPVGNGLVLKARAYRTSLGVIGSGLFWLVCTLSAMTAWMLIANWRHTRRRMQAQQALLLETNFRRAMENSMPTGMRALDLQGRITYVNTAFCQMTGWREDELVGQTAPFPYWPEEDQELLRARLDDELQGRVSSTGFQIRVKRKNGTVFDARIHVSPLIDARGQQTGWMTSMTDITEPNRVREQLSASHQRLVSVAMRSSASTPLSRKECILKPVTNCSIRANCGIRSSGGAERFALYSG
ncbi:MAG: PAS domain S-box protein [Burkholderiales bacterium]|nr:PAS domain S-box protein [Burkholderiales bacterium]